MSLNWLQAELQAKHAAGQWRRRRTFRPQPEGMVEVDGRRLLNLSGNDYLGLAGDARVVAAAKQAMDTAGFGARASALVSGRSDWHERLEQKLAEFEETAAAILFPTGYAANVGTIAALAGADDALFCDRLNHASLIDGCRLSQARFRVYPHLDLETLERELRKALDVRRRVIVTDAVFSMDGDVAPLPALLDLANRYDALLLVDEAHATGVLGPQGRGLCEHFDLRPAGLVRTGTLSKALGSLGGFVAGEQVLIDWLWNAARPQVFSTALPAACAAAATAAVEIVQAEPERREGLLNRARRLRQLLVERGYDLPATELVTPILPVVIGEESRTMAAAAALEEKGFLVGAIRPPTVPRGTSRLRISLHAAVSDAQIDELVAALQRCVPPLNQ